MHSSQEHRQHMVEGQLTPNRILNANVTEAMQRVMRESFVPESYHACAYTDGFIPLDKGRFMLSPLLLGQLLQAADPHPGEKILLIACSTGYNAAVASEMGCTVYALEEHADLANKARQNLMKDYSDHIQVHTGSLHAGLPNYQPFDHIIIAGGVQRDVSSLSSQLQPHGRLTYIHTEQLLPQPHMGTGMIVTCDYHEGRLIEAIGEDVIAPLIPSLAKPEPFEF